jgi:hypothetical protein
MELLILGIISVISKKVTTNGYNLMMKEFANSTLLIYSLNVLVDNIGEDKVRVLIF